VNPRLTRSLRVLDAGALGFALGLLMAMAVSPVIGDVLALLVPLGAALVLARPDKAPPAGLPVVAVLGLILGIASGKHALRTDPWARGVIEARRALLEQVGVHDRASQDEHLQRWIHLGPPPTAVGLPGPPSQPVIVGPLDAQTVGIIAATLPDGPCPENLRGVLALLERGRTPEEVLATLDEDAPRTPALTEAQAFAAEGRARGVAPKRIVEELQQRCR
jgi:hypothetical protein